MLEDTGAGDLAGLYATARGMNDPRAGADYLQEALMRVWRVSRKIGAMFLSATCNPDLSGLAAPWREGIDWTRFVVIDSNTDLFLASIGYRGAGTYDARLRFLSALSAKVDLSALAPALAAFNPRLVQQAMYMFMSASNRRASAQDCRGERTCRSCPQSMRSRCPVEPC
jgi:hypothetical protein